MKQHPVPQHISSYEFHLIGDMTLKQFGYVVFGGAIALIFYVSSWNFLLKAIGIPSGLLLGVSLAFLKIQERPLDRWIINFFKAIYSPTRYLWKKSKKLPSYLTATPPSFKKIQETLLEQEKTKKKVPLAEYLQSLPQAPTQLTSAEKTEVQRLQKISQFLQTPFVPPPLPVTPPPEIQPEGLKIRPLTQKSKIKSPTKPSSPPPILKKPKTVKTRPSQTAEPPIKTRETLLKISKTLPKPQKPKKTTTQAVLKPTLPILERPTQPNIIVGMVIDKNNKIVENAIIEIQDQKGIPQRALKTNKLGQFRIATPLKNDTYSILVEKEGLNFDIIKITLDGKIVSPIEIKAS